MKKAIKGVFWWKNYINIFDYHNQNSFEEYHTELKTLFEFMRYASEKEKLKELLASKDKAYYNVDNETYGMIAELTNSKELLKHRQEHEMKEESNMCQAITEMIEEGKIQGLVEAYKELGITKMIVQEKLQQKFSLSPEKAKEYVEQYW